MAITAEASANIAGFDRMKRAIFPPAQLANADCAPVPAAASAITAAPTATSPAQPKEVSVFVTNDRHAAMRPLATAIEITDAPGHDDDAFVRQLFA
jgi:hypothetical protein